MWELRRLVPFGNVRVEIRGAASGRLLQSANGDVDAVGGQRMQTKTIATQTYRFRLNGFPFSREVAREDQHR